MQPQSVEFPQHQKCVLENEEWVAVRLHPEGAVNGALDDRSATHKAGLKSMLESEALEQSEGCCHFGHGGRMDGAVLLLGDEDGSVFRLNKNALICPEMGGRQ